MLMYIYRKNCEICNFQFDWLNMFVHNQLYVLFIIGPSVKNVRIVLRLQVRML